MYESTDPDPDLAKTRKSAAEARTRRVLLFVAPQDSVSEPLVDALEREFPWIIVEQVEDLQAAMVRFRAPVLLILIDSVFLYEIDACAFELSRFHPAAAKAVLHDDLRSPLKASDVLASRNLRGVLPMMVVQAESVAFGRREPRRGGADASAGTGDQHDSGHEKSPTNGLEMDRPIPI